MKLLTTPIRQKMLKNWSIPDEKKGDLMPVVKLFTPYAGATWLLTELKPDDPQDICFGLCDLGQGFPELGYVSMEELMAGQGKATVERDRGFTATKTLLEYTSEARHLGQINT